MPLSRIRPLDVKLSYEDLPYSLGEHIPISVEVYARGDVEVREAWIDLVCEETYIESYTMMVPDRKTYRAPDGPLSSLHPDYTPTPMVEQRVSKKHKKTYVHSSVVFLTNQWLAGDSTTWHEATLKIEPLPPAHWTSGTVKWKLVATLDVASARDVRARGPVSITRH
ncbi:MAG: hypothetical protein HYX93_00145 [Chloroflexi bacterium]|nr:hypothetical protein [Chloroflexota bacterium]